MSRKSHEENETGRRFVCFYSHPLRLSVHLDQEASDALANAVYLREWNLVEPLAEKNFGRVEEYWNDLEARTDKEIQRTYAEILVTLARGRYRYPNNPILRAPIPPPNRIERDLSED